jgi:hypothetical protein
MGNLMSNADSDCTKPHIMAESSTLSGGHPMARELRMRYQIMQSPLRGMAGSSEYTAADIGTNHRNAAKQGERSSRSILATSHPQRRMAYLRPRLLMPRLDM